MRNTSPGNMNINNGMMVVHPNKRRRHACSLPTLADASRATNARSIIQKLTKETTNAHIMSMIARQNASTMQSMAIAMTKSVPSNTPMRLTWWRRTQSARLKQT